MVINKIYNGFGNNDIPSDVVPACQTYYADETRYKNCIPTYGDGCTLYTNRQQGIYVLRPFTLRRDSDGVEVYTFKKAPCFYLIVVGSNANSNAPNYEATIEIRNYGQERPGSSAPYTVEYSGTLNFTSKSDNYIQFYCSYE